MKIYLGLDNKTQEDVLINWNGTIQELEKKEDCANKMRYKDFGFQSISKSGIYPFTFLEKKFLSFVFLNIILQSK